MTSRITVGCFPTPQVALRSNDRAEQDRVGRFGGSQAVAARSLRHRLIAGLASASGLGDRAGVFEDGFRWACDWRYRLAWASDTHLGGHDLAHDAERFRMPIGAGCNFDALGTLGRLRDGAVWDAATRRFVGGAATPASRQMERIGVWAWWRWDDTEPSGAGVCQNRVLVPDGRRVDGNRLLRGAQARQAADEVELRVHERGGPVRMERAELYCQTADSGDRAVLHSAAIRALAELAGRPTREHEASQRLWSQVAYLLYQAPLMKKGSDAVTRVFLVAAGAILLDRPPRLPQDIDLRAMVLPQDEFVPWLLERV